MKINANTIILIGFGSIIYYTYKHGQNAYNYVQKLRDVIIPVSNVAVGVSASDTVVSVQEIDPLAQVSAKNGTIFGPVQSYNVTTSSGSSFVTSYQPTVGKNYNTL